jgi:hypothetical protein
MANTGLGEGHEKTATGASAYQNDGLRDTDVLASPSLTNMVERGLMNGVVPITINRYDESDRNNPITGNCCVRPNGTIGSTKEIYVDVGTVALDGMFFTVGSGSVFDIAAATNLHTTHGSTAIANPSGADEEAIMLVVVDPREPSNVALVYGSFVDTSTGVYPQSPSAHLDRQTVVLASMRIGKGSSNPVVLSIEDKRTFVRPGPIPLSTIEHSDGSENNLRNDFVAGYNAANLPITDLGVLFARNPAGFHAGTVAGSGHAHLFFQSDQTLGPGNGGAYQLTPVHRQAMKQIAYSGALTINYPATGATDIRFSPILSPDPGASATYLLDIHAHDGASRSVNKRLIQGIDYTITSTQINVVAPSTAGVSGASTLDIRYTHSGY